MTIKKVSNPKAPGEYQLPYQLIIGLLGLLLSILLMVYLLIPAPATESNGAGTSTGNSTSTRRPSERKSPASRTRVGKVNINTASPSELKDLVRGIGAATARRIVERRKIRPFESIEEVRELQGVTDRNFQMMKDRITVK